MNSRTIALLLVTSLLASACGTVSNKTSVEALPSDAFRASDTGVVVLSAGAPEHCYSMGTFLGLHYLPSGNAVSSAPLILVDGYVHKSDFAGHHGTVNALQLAPGTYYLTPISANPYFRVVTAPIFQFEARAGETTYIGELFMTRSCVLDMDIRFVINDQYERDIQVAAQKNPAVTLRTPVKRLTSPGAPR